MHPIYKQERPGAGGEDMAEPGGAAGARPGGEGHAITVLQISLRALDSQRIHISPQLRFTPFCLTKWFQVQGLVQVTSIYLLNQRVAVSRPLSDLRIYRVHIFFFVLITILSIIYVHQTRTEPNMHIYIF